MLKNLDRLKIFYHIFSQKSIVAASNTLNVSQSAVSQSLQKLEKEIKCPLFIRLHKKLIPTAAGEKLYGIVESFMLEVDSYLKDLEQSKQAPYGELRIGSPPEFGKTYLSMVMAEFRELYPDVTFCLDFGDPNKLLSLLREGRIDFILLDEFLARSPFIESLDAFLFEPVIKEDVIMACSKEYYENKIKGDLSFSSLSRQNFVSYKKDMQTINMWFRENFSKSVVNVHSVMTVDNHEGVTSAIMHNIGMGVVASHIVKDELDSGEMVKIKTSKPDIVNTISLVQILNKIPTLAERVFAQFLIDRIQAMTADNEKESYK